MCVFLSVFVCTFCSLASAPFALPRRLPICWLPVKLQLPPFLLPPSSLLPPCSLIPPSPSLFVCHLVSYVRGMGGEWIWCLGAIRLTSRRRLALPRVLWWHWSVFSVSWLVREREREIRLWRTNGCTWGFQYPFAQVSRAEATLIEHFWDFFFWGRMIVVFPLVAFTRRQKHVSFDSSLNIHCCHWWWSGQKRRVAYWWWWWFIFSVLLIKMHRRILKCSRQSLFDQSWMKMTAFFSHPSRIWKLYLDSVCMCLLI